MIQVFLAGEGRNELGSRAGHPSYHSPAQPGLLESLLHRVREGGWRVVGARSWKDLRKLKASGASARFAPDEATQIARLLLHAEEAGAHVVAFVRDGDDASEVRQRALRAGIEQADKALAVVAEVAIPKLEAWVLALRGHPRTETLTSARVEALFAAEGLAAKSTEDMVRVVHECQDLAKVPEDARGLRAWLDAAREALRPEGD
jgi:hypothetical protein